MKRKLQFTFDVFVSHYFYYVIYFVDDGWLGVLEFIGYDVEIDINDCKQNKVKHWSTLQT